MKSLIKNLHKTCLAVTVLALCGLAPVGLAADAAVPVGATTIELANPANARTFSVEFFYATAADAKVESLSFRPPMRPVHVARGAEAQVGSAKRALIVVSHGNWGSRYSEGWLALELVRAGYVVLSTTHPGTSGDDQSAAGRYRLWDRASDVSFALDQILKDRKWAPLIDERRVGFIGHSFGGWAGVSLAGGRFDPARQRAWCEAHPASDLYCKGTLKDDISAIPIGDAGASYRDARIKAYYIMASGPAQGFSEESLKAIQAPFMVDTALQDTVLEPRSNSGALAALIPNAREIRRPVGHFAYVPECRPFIGALLTKIAGLPICDDPDGVDRGAVHQQIARDVVQFFGVGLPVANQAGHARVSSKASE